MSPRALLRRKYAVFRAVARDTVNMQPIGGVHLRGTIGRPRIRKNDVLQKKAPRGRSVFGVRACPHRGGQGAL